MSIENLARPEILKMKAYESARSLNTEGRIFLDANESPSSPISLQNANRYPDPQPKALVERLCSLYQVTSKQIMIGRGSDEAIDLLVRVFCAAGKDQILICPPTYGMYEISANIQGAGITRVPMILDREKSRLNEDGIIQAIQDGVKIVFICSPNNPTGTPFDRAVISRICEAARGKSIVVADEAYMEFSESTGMIPEIPKHENLVVLRTLSKAWAVAGLRCGVALGQEPLINLLQKVRAPYPLPTPAVISVMEATDSIRQEALSKRVKLIQTEKTRMITELQKINSVDFIYPSSANFILVKFKNPSTILTQSKAKGIILRDRSTVVGLEGCIRITLGSPEENQQVLSLIREAGL